MTDDHMLAEHRQTYERFVKSAAFSTVLIAVILALMALFLL